MTKRLDLPPEPGTGRRSCGTRTLGPNHYAPPCSSNASGGASVRRFVLPHHLRHLKIPSVRLRRRFQGLLLIDALFDVVFPKDVGHV